MIVLKILSKITQKKSSINKEDQNDIERLKDKIYNENKNIGTVDKKWQRTV
jgi:hypothetical protein